MTKLRGLKQKLFNKISALILKYDLAENDVEISTNNFGNETTISLNFKMSDNKIWNDQTVSFYQNNLKPKPPPAMTTDSMTCYLKKFPLKVIVQVRCSKRNMILRLHVLVKNPLLRRFVPINLLLKL